MSEQQVIDEVTVAVEVAVPLDHAFRVFTEQFDSIKPREHNLLSVDIAETVLEASRGARSTTGASMEAPACGAASSM